MSTKNSEGIVMSIEQAVGLGVDENLTKFADTVIFRDLQGVIDAEALATLADTDSTLTLALGRYLAVGRNARNRFISVDAQLAQEGTVKRPEQFNKPFEASVLVNELIKLISTPVNAQ